MKKSVRIKTHKRRLKNGRVVVVRTHTSKLSKSHPKKVADIEQEQLNEYVRKYKLNK